MFPESSAPPESQAWVRDVSDRASSGGRKAASNERNAYSLAAASKSASALVSQRIANINTFTTGLFEQGIYSDTVGSFAALDAKPTLYEYASGDFQVKNSVIQRIPFSRYNELTVTADGFLNSFTTNAAATGIDGGRPVLPMIQATIPSLAIMLPDGRYIEGQLSYASRWTVENFEQFLPYNIPGNVVPNAYSSTYAQAPPGYHPDNGNVQIRQSRDGYTGHSMKYTRQWLMEYMQAIADFTQINTPPPAGAKYYPPDVNLVEIVLGYFYQPYTSATATNTLYINDNRLSFNAGATFSLEGIRNMGY